MPSTTIARGNALQTFYVGAVLANGSNTLTANTTTAVTYTVPGIQATDYILVQGVVGSQTAGVIIAEADATAANTIQIQYGNLTSNASLTPASGTYVIQVVRSDGPLPASAV